MLVETLPIPLPVGEGDPEVSASPPPNLPLKGEGRRFASSMTRSLYMLLGLFNRAEFPKKPIGAYRRPS